MGAALGTYNHIFVVHLRGKDSVQLEEDQVYNCQPRSTVCVHVCVLHGAPHPLTCMAWSKFSVDVLKQWKVRSFTIL